MRRSHVGVRHLPHSFSHFYETGSLTQPGRSWSVRCRDFLPHLLCSAWVAGTYRLAFPCVWSVATQGFILYQLCHLPSPIVETLCRSGPKSDSQGKEKQAALASGKSSHSQRGSRSDCYNRHSIFKLYVKNLWFSFLHESVNQLCCSKYNPQALWVIRTATSLISFIWF